MNILVLDVGSSSMRGILFDEAGAELASKQIPYLERYLPNGWVEQDAREWEKAMCTILAHIFRAAGDHGHTVDAISLTAQRSSVIPVDADVEPLTPAIMWQDKRTMEICGEAAQYNEEIFSICGARVNPVFSATKMTWIRENQPEIYAKTYKFLTVSSFLLHRLTGKLCTDYTYGSRSLLMNLRTHQWDDRLLEIFRVEKSKLCTLIPPGSICGRLNEEMARRVGGRKDIPVISAGGDQQCGAIGQGVVEEGTLSVTAGTGGFLITAVNRVPENLRSDVVCNDFSIRGMYILESNVICCCSAFDWYIRNFSPSFSYEELNELAMSSPIGAGGVRCLPYFQGRSTPDWNSSARANFYGIGLNSQKSDMLRALLEGICFEIANGIDTMKRYTEIKTILVNGGLTNSPVFNAIQADVYGTTLERRGKADATARGALAVAMEAVGICGSVAEAMDRIQSGESVKTYEPVPENIPKYLAFREEMNDIYRKLYPDTLN